MEFSEIDFIMEFSEIDFCKNLTEFYQISLKICHTDWSPQLMAGTHM